jgi:hypothetical protein
MASSTLIARDNPVFFTPPPKRGFPLGRLWKGGGGPAPTPPDPVATANAQAAANITTANAQANLNRYNEQTPFGTSTWTPPTSEGGQWTNTFQLDPNVQKMLQSYYGAANTPIAGVSADSPYGADIMSGSGYRAQALGMTQPSNLDPAISVANGVTTGAGSVANQALSNLSASLSKPFNYDSAPAMPTADNATRQAVSDAYYNQQKSRLDPQWQQAQSDLEARLANQGITQGSEAYNREMGNFARARTDAYSTANNTSIQNGTDAMAKLFGMQLGARQQGVDEANTLRLMPLQEAQGAAGIFGTAAGAESGLADARTQAAQAAANIAGINSSTDWAGKTNDINTNLAVHQSNLGDRTQVLNQLMALAGGSQMQAPGASPVQVAETPVASSIYNSYQGAVNNYNAQQQANASMFGSIGQIGMSAAMLY